MAGFVNFIVIDIDDVHPFHQCLPLRALHLDNVLVLQSHTCTMRAFQHFVPVWHFCGTTVRQNRNTAILLFHHIELFVGKQCCHTELGYGREYALNTVQRDLALGFTTELLSKRCCHLIAQRIGDNDIHSAITGCHPAAVELLLLIDFQNASILGKLILANICPVGSQLIQEPAVVQAFYFLHHMFEQVIQHFVGNGQTAIKTQMELTIVGVHLIVIGYVGVPNIPRLCQMETGGMVMEEYLHVRHLKKSFIIAGNRIVPRHRPALFHNGRDDIRLNDMVANILHQVR